MFMIKNMVLCFNLQDPVIRAGKETRQLRQRSSVPKGHLPSETPPDYHQVMEAYFQIKLLPSAPCSCPSLLHSLPPSLKFKFKFKFKVPEAAGVVRWLVV